MSGFQVSPKELEDLLFRESYVADAAVAGVQNEDGTEIPWAFLVASKEAALLASEERNTAVLHSINAKVAGYKKIKGITWLEALPKSESGKVLKRKLERPMPQL
jgi:4-coumarate--CoA ligase